MSSPQSYGSSPSHNGQTIAAIRHRVTVELDRINALGLADLKSALDTANSQKEAVVKDYRAKYKGFRERWWCEQQLIAKLHQALTCTYERHAWKEIARDCVCRLNREIHERSVVIDEKTNCSKGDLECAATRAQAERDKAKADKDAWTGAAATIDQQLTANDTLAKNIQTLIGNADPQAIYKFWFTLLPAHRALMPDDAPPSARELGEGESPEDICGFEHHGGRTPPWLVDPDRFGHVLDESWERYYTAQVEYSRATAEYLENKDDLAALTQARDALKAALDANIAACLKRHGPNGACSTDATAAPALASAAGAASGTTPKPATK
jgi:hypothetical protein